MGQYWKPVNLDKKEFVNPHALGCGLKLWEQLANHPGTGAALIILQAAMPEARGGGDLDLDENWHGVERKFPEHNTTGGPMPDGYEALAARTIGRWAGDRVVLVGDYAEPDDIQGADLKAVYDDLENYEDITSDVRRVIEHELQGKFEGDDDGWCTWVPVNA